MLLTEARFFGTGDVRLLKSEPAPLSPAEVAIAPLAVGVCGTDSHIVAGSFAAEPQVVLGHEVCGRITEVGAAVDGLTVGDLVTVEPHDYCTRCTYCRLGQEHLCDNKRGYGVKLDGGMTERMVLPARIAYRLPDATPPWIGALTEPLACCLHGMDQLNPRSGLPILIFGAGPAGAMMVALAKARGLAPVVVLDPRADRRDAATRMGADAALDPASLDGATALTDGLGFPHVIDAVGSGRILESAITVSSRGGGSSSSGWPGPTTRPRVRPNEIFARELTVVGAVINPYTHHRAVQMLPALGLDRLRPAFYGLDQLPEALEAQRTGTADKVFIAPHGIPAAQG
ncbi:alcohol dehydrogenase catalytic domain-containing protein [Micromonospora sp. ATA32]|nr:alcohol dehydrogenase catalytic domain-containing protein [Micromonospora sp. ATA32]